MEAGPSRDKVHYGGVRIANGYEKSGQTFNENSRVKQLRVELNGRPQALLNLLDTDYIQYFGSGPIETVKPGDRLRFVITAVYPGTRYQDTCISDMVLDGAH